MSGIGGNFFSTCPEGAGGYRWRRRRSEAGAAAPHPREPRTATAPSASASSGGACAALRRSTVRDAPSPPEEPRGHSIPPPLPSPPAPLPAPPAPTSPRQGREAGGAQPASVPQASSAAARPSPTCRVAPGAAQQQPEVQRDPDHTGAQQHQPVSHWPPQPPAPSPSRRPLPAAPARRPGSAARGSSPLGRAGLGCPAAAGSCSPASARAGGGGAGGGGGRLQPPQCRGAPRKRGGSARFTWRGRGRGAGGSAASPSRSAPLRDRPAAPGCPRLRGNPPREIAIP